MFVWVRKIIWWNKNVGSNLIWQHVATWNFLATKGIHLIQLWYQLVLERKGLAPNRLNFLKTINIPLRPSRALSIRVGHFSANQEPSNAKKGFWLANNAPQIVTKGVELDIQSSKSDNWSKTVSNNAVVDKPLIVLMIFSWKISLETDNLKKY